MKTCSPMSIITRRADDSTVSSLSLLFVSPGTTRAVSEGTISSVYVILSDKAKSQGNIAYKTALQPTNGKVTLKVRPSNYNVYVWANVPAKNFQSVSTLGDLDRVMYGSLSSYSELPMHGKGTATVPPDKTVTTSMVLNHLTAKLAFNIVSEYPASTVVSAKLYHNTVEIPFLAICQRQLTLSQQQTAQTSRSRSMSGETV